MSIAHRLRRLLKSFLPRGVVARLRATAFARHNRGFVPHQVPITHGADSFVFFAGDAVGAAWAKSGWDWAEIDFLRERMVEPGDVVLEAGAHHGEMTLFFSRWVGEHGRVVAIDAVPRNAEIIEENARLNDLGNVTVVHAAVGATDGTALITDESNAQVIAHGHGLRVPVVPLDRYLDLKPTLLKIDVEGFEDQALEGARAILATRPKLAIEVHASLLHERKLTPQDILDRLHLDTYDVWVQPSDTGVVTSYTGAPIVSTTHVFAVPRPISA